MGKTLIDWTDETWNPVTGCSKVSPGCKHCYAERMAKRLAGRAGYPKDAPFRVTLHPDRLELPLHWRQPRRVFVNSMSDLFHESVPDEFIDLVFAIMALTGRHTYQLLAKRTDRMAAYLCDPEAPKRIGLLTWVEWSKQIDIWVSTLEDWWRDGVPWPLPNVHLGVTVENDDYRWRIEKLLQVPAAVHFVSCEPMLEPVDLSAYLPHELFTCKRCGEELSAGEADHSGRHGYCGGELDPQGATEGLDWVICGCESGPRRRPMDESWVRSLKDQCSAAGTPFFLKQMEVDGKLQHNPRLDGRTWEEFPNG